MKQVFVSYAREDATFAEELENQLTSAGLDVWKDSSDLAAGDEWRARIDAALDSCDVIVVVVTQAAMGSHFVTYEWARAMGASKPLVPLLVDDAELHPRLEALQHMDFRFEQPWSRLLLHIGSLRGRQTDVPAAVENTRMGLDDPDPAVQLKALRGLARLRHSAALTYLVQALDHPSASVSREAATLLGRRDDPEAVEALRLVVEAGDSPAGEHALWALSERPRPPEVGRMLRQLVDSDEPLKRAVAVRSMGHSADAADLPRLLTVAGDPSPHVRRYVWEALVAYGAAAIPTLLEAAEAQPSPEARFTLVRSFHHIGDGRAVPFLTRQLHDQTPIGDGSIQPSEHGFSWPKGTRPLADYARAALGAIDTDEARAALEG